MDLGPAPIFIGCAGWSIPRDHTSAFPEDGTHLERYAQRFPAVEINSSFYRPHRPTTYERWAASVPDDFRFAVKVPREITHVRRLRDCGEPLARFLSEVEHLGEKLGPLLVQLPPTLRFDATIVEPFFSLFRASFAGDLVCEPRHRSWFTQQAEQLLNAMRIARAAADPAAVPEAALPGGWAGLVYYRLHGSPVMYESTYDDAYLRRLSLGLQEAARAAATWCIFDNTALGAATANALWLLARLRGDEVAARLTHA